ncbi:MAG: S49 family peptidase [Rhodospirillales bacterium]|nr:S49 family peptidase [Rhodospirillales bacterium]
MTHSVAAARLAGRPLALAPRALDAMLAMAGLPLSPPNPSAAGHLVLDSGIAIVPVVGPLVSRGDWLSELFGAASYGDIGDAIAAAFADPAVRAVLLEVDSPGGEVGGLFDLVERIGALRQDAGKPLWAVASEAALSAGYAIASAADRLYVTRTGEVGSVGVVAVHVDESAADAMAGLKWTLIHAGARKTDGNPHEPLSPGALAGIQADVDALHAEFVALVAGNRRLGVEAVRASEAAIFRGRAAVAAGFADALGTVTQAVADLATSLDPPRPAVRRPPAASYQERTPPQMTTETTEPVAEPLPAPEPAPPVPDPAEALRAEYAEIAEIAAQAARLGVGVDAAAAMRQGTRPEALRRSVLDSLAQRAEASAVVAAAPAATIAGDSPIVRRARERAAAGRTA